jgi:hypothetical protein
MKLDAPLPRRNFTANPDSLLRPRGSFSRRAAAIRAGDFGMTKLGLLYAQNLKNRSSARSLLARNQGQLWRAVATLSVEDHSRVEKHYVSSKSADQLEGLIRDNLPNPVEQHLLDVIIERIDVDGLGANWTAQPVWNHDVSNNDEQEFISALFEVLRDYDLLTDD